MREDLRTVRLGDSPSFFGQYLMVWASSPEVPQSGQVYFLRMGQLTRPSASFKTWLLYTHDVSPLFLQNTHTFFAFALFAAFLRSLNAITSITIGLLSFCMVIFSLQF